MRILITGPEGLERSVSFVMDARTLSGLGEGAKTKTTSTSICCRTFDCLWPEMSQYRRYAVNCPNTAKVGGSLPRQTSAGVQVSTNTR